MGKIVMVGITTKQETSNAVPAAQLSVDYYFHVDTEYAVKSNWGVGTLEVLSDKNVNVGCSVYLGGEESTKIPVMIEKIKKALKQQALWDEAILWNLGGGQKLQQLALWFLYQSRLREHKTEDRLVYAEPSSARLILIWSNKEGNMEQQVLPLRSNFTIEELLKIYGGFRVKGGVKECYYTDVREAWKLIKRIYNETTSGSESKGLNLERSMSVLLRDMVERYRKRSYKGRFRLDSRFWSDFRKALSRHIFVNLEKSDREIVERCCFSQGFKKHVSKLYSSGNFNSPENTVRSMLRKVLECIDGRVKSKSFSFERALQSIIVHYIRDIDSKGEFFVDYGMNVEIEKSDQPGYVIAEHDLLLATSTGTLVSFDAKSGFALDSHREKDWLARKHRIERAGGTYAKWVAVFPEEFVVNYPDDVSKVKEDLHDECDVVVLSSKGKDYVELPSNPDVKIVTLRKYIKDMLTPYK